MKAFKLVAFFLVLLAITVPLGAQTANLLPDSEAYIEAFFRLWRLQWQRFVFIGNPDVHPVQIIWKRQGWFDLQWIISRSYIHFSKNDLPRCFVSASLRLRFTTVYDAPVLVTIEAVDWDGTTSPGWYSQPSGYWRTSFTVSSPGWREVDVTQAVKEALDQGYELAFRVKLTFEIPRWSTYGRREASFVRPYMKLQLCHTDVKVDGLKDAVVEQKDIASRRYISLGELKVGVKANVPYEVRACYEVDPPPSPPFSADPVDIAYTWVWINMPACPSYIVLPGFSGAPGSETHIYRVRVDLADLGDRAAGEGFEFAIRVWAVPQ